MFAKIMKRTVIIGNGGSGKSFLARKLSSASGITVVHLDELFWEPGGFNQKRHPEVVRSEINAQKEAAEWIVEGVFGELAELFISRATYLVWLDLPWAVCREGLISRGSESSRQLDPVKAKENFKNLLVWAENYWNRKDQTSHYKHQEIFKRFKGDKAHIKDRDSIGEIFGRASE
jgi:adenylate kinase family enzyme